MAWLLVPAADRARLRRVLARLDVIAGYPRTHADDEPEMRRGALAPAAVTTTLALVLRHDLTGPAALQGALAVRIKPDMRAALAERFVETVDGRKRLREWIADQGWELRATLPDAPTTLAEASHWTLLAPRDGAAGSVDGVPIPEGEE